MCHNLTPLRLTCLLSILEMVSKGYWKGKVNLDKERTSTAFWYKCILPQVCTCVLIAFCSYLSFWWGNGVRGPKRSPVLVLNAKGGEIKAKANGSANHLWISQNCRVRIFVFDQNPLICKNFLLWGRISIMGKGGVFGIWSNLLLKDLSIYQNKCVGRSDRKKNLFCENKPSGGKSDPNMPNSLKTLLVFNLHFWVLIDMLVRN